MKLTDKPAYCAACFGQEDTRYVDFGAAYDGPVLTLPDGRPQPIDDLVVCERCLNAAFDLLDPQGLKPELERLQKNNQSINAQLQRTKQANASLAKAHAELSEIARTGKRGKAQKAVSEEVKQQRLDNLAKAREAGAKKRAKALA